MLYFAHRSHRSLALALTLLSACEAADVPASRCTAAACHDEAKVGDLDLCADVAWENLGVRLRVRCMCQRSEAQVSDGSGST